MNEVGTKKAVIAIVACDNTYEAMLSSIKEAKARGGTGDSVGGGGR